MYDHADLLKQKKENTFANQFVNYGSRSVFTPMAMFIETAKDIFSASIGLGFAYSYLRNKGPGSWEYEVNPYSIGMKMKDPSFIERTYLGSDTKRPVVYVGRMQYSGGALSAPFAAWNYLMRNLGKFVGLTLVLPIITITVPITFLRASYGYISDNIRINKELKQCAESVSDNSNDLPTSSSSAFIAGQLSQNGSKTISTIQNEEKIENKSTPHNSVSASESSYTAGNDTDKQSESTQSPGKKY